MFFYSKFSLFHNSNVFGSFIIHISYRGCAKIKKNSGSKRLKLPLPTLQKETTSALINIIFVSY